MTTIQVELPDATAKAARDAGLLTPQSLARLLNEALKRQQAADALLSVAARVTAGGIPSMSVDEINAEVKAARTSRICSRRQSDLSQQRRTPCCKKSVRGPVSGHYRTPCRKRHSADVQPQRDRAPIGRPSRTTLCTAGVVAGFAIGSPCSCFYSVSTSSSPAACPSQSVFRPYMSALRAIPRWQLATVCNVNDFCLLSVRRRCD